MEQSKANSTTCLLGGQESKCQVDKRVKGLASGRCLPVQNFLSTPRERSEAACAAPVSKVESHISDRCSHSTGQRFVSALKLSGMV